MPDEEHKLTMEEATGGDPLLEAFFTLVKTARSVAFLFAEFELDRETWINGKHDKTDMSLTAQRARALLLLQVALEKVTEEFRGLRDADG